ncbi:WD repeat-containing protein 6-like [Plutella xylostella]|uniref:WD repeat-containing protein 6-like n=1 Tax=Plutella xylostella TaxID=51655 RepID=UPI002032C3FA|nr:WD repeat-containing protein 6-like [Plutella xylostella]
MSVPIPHIIKTDITAVKLFGNIVLAGIGSWAHVYDIVTKKLLQTEHVLRGQKIYGFIPSKYEGNVIIFGGKQFSIASIDWSFNRDRKVLRLNPRVGPIICDDWLHAVVWTKEEEIAALTAHNVVQIWNTSQEPFLITSFHSKDNSILYSGCLVPLDDDVLVLAGTVFTDVIIHACSETEPLMSLKGHRGVIFSISCDIQKQLIVTTSDDRSIRIWGPSTTVTTPANTKEYWKTVAYDSKYEVYGHTARVMRSYITDDLIISVGEDSVVCFWDFQGNILKKNMAHQNGCIWSLDADRKNLVTGGGDSGLVLHPLTVAKEYGEHEILHADVGNPKKIYFTTRRNIVILNERDELQFYDVVLKSVTETHKLTHESTYKLMSLSSCKQFVAVADMAGNLDVFAETCKGEPTLRKLVNTKMKFGKILSMHWAGNRHLVVCSDNGNITILASKGNEVETVTNFSLPQSKERWLTAAGIDSKNRLFAVGDRCGNVHIYIIGKNNPVKTLNKVHGRYGPTSITIIDNGIITTGRDGTVKHFDLAYDTVKYMKSIDLNFEWVEKFLDKNENIVCGFQEIVFVVYDITNRSKLVEVPCGGGHRSWDAVRYIEQIQDNYDEFIKLIYLKNSELHESIFQLSKIVSKNIVNGCHTKEINCLQSHLLEDKSAIYLISGGEDTTLRISIYKNTENGPSFHDSAIFKHLSSIRTVKTFNLDSTKITLVSAGGRAQICIKVIEFKDIENKLTVESEELVDYQVRGTDKERKGNQNWKSCGVDVDPEMRMMDIEIIKVDNGKFLIVAACSDAILRLYEFEYSDKNNSFKPAGVIKYHKTCILKTKTFKFQEKYILITCTTRGQVAFWNVTDDLISNNIEHDIITDDAKPFFVTTTNKSGINSVDVKVISKDEVIFATGGDDNAIHVNNIKFKNFKCTETQETKVDNFHCSEVTGLSFMGRNLILSTSIDQRITLSKYEMNDDGLTCSFVSQRYSDVPDIQGIDVICETSDKATVCVFGKGLEVLNVDKPR